MTTGTLVRDQNLEKHIHKQMGCMAGFLHIFDRHQILAGKRISAKRLPPPEPDTSPEPEKRVASPARSTAASPERVKQSPAREAVNATLPVLEIKEGTTSTWKFSRDAPRLSLDSRTLVRTSAPCPNLAPDGEKQLQRRSTSSTSVVARLMGLEPLPDSGSGSDPGPNKNPELRRSASESRASRDLNRFFDANNGFQFLQKQVQQTQPCAQPQGIASVVHGSSMSNAGSDPVEHGARNAKGGGGGDRGNARNRGVVIQKKSFYDSADFFPEPKRSVSIYGEIEKKLKMRGIDEPLKDLETLKHILEALQLKGLLHSKNNQMNRSNSNMNLVLDGIRGTRMRNQSPIVVIKPSRSSDSVTNRTGRIGSESPPSSVKSSPRARRNEVPEIDRRSRNAKSPAPGAKSPNRRNVTNAENHHRRVCNNDGVDSRKVSPVQSPRISTRRNGPVHSPRTRKPIDQKEEKVLVVAEDESSTVSESSFSTSSHNDTERFKLEEYREGRNLLDRCDKLLSSIAEMTASSELQPSPVSVLDSSFYRDEWCSPSPITKRCIDYKDQAAESEDDVWSAALCSSSSEAKSDEASEDCDFAYVSEILRACSYLPEDGDVVFALLEKQQCLKGKDTSEASKLQRKLVFDTVREIVSRHRRLPPWKAVAYGGEERERVWSEFRRIRRDREEEEEEEDVSEEDMFEVVCGVLRKDMAEDVNFGWGEWTVEMGDVVLDIERLVFKDLICETIRELASSASSQCNRVSVLRRKLVF